MSTLGALLRNSSSEKSSPDDEKLMDLYWNRNELKKEFADLRSEKHRLQDVIKQRDGDIARLQQKLEHLEQLLIDQEWARNALVFYQLRGMNQRCQNRLGNFAEQLKQQREKRQYGQAMEQWQAKQTAETKAVDDKISTLRAERLQLEDQLKAMNRQLSDMNGVSRLFKGRSVTGDIDDLAQQISTKEQEEAALRESLAAIQAREKPAVTGLDVATKRQINFMILAFAQQLFAMFDDDELVLLVKEAGEKSAGAVKYGDDRDCEHLLTRVQRSADAMQKNGDFAETLQRRAVLIGERAEFNSSNDTVPVAGSVSTLFRIGATGLVTEDQARILGDNFWGIASVMSR